MRTKIFSFAAIAAMTAMPIVSSAEDKTVGERMGNAVDKVADAVTGKDQPNDAAMAPKFPAGIEVKTNSDLDDIRGSLAKIVNRTLSTDGFDDAVAYLANQDRDRIKAQLGDSNKDLNGKVEQFRGIFKQKYGEDFDVKSDLLNSSTAIQQGEVKDATMARANWPMNAMGRDDAGRAVADRPANDDPKFENGRDVAGVRVTGMKATDAVILSLQHELPDYWVIDVPNSTTSAGLLRSQSETLTKMIENADAWPKMKEEAYRVISYKILHGFTTDTAKDPVANTPRD